MSMVQQTSLILIVVSALIGNSALASPKAPAQFNIIELLHSFHMNSLQKLNRSTSSDHQTTVLPSLVFKKEVNLDSFGSAQIGNSCVVRTVTKSCTPHSVSAYDSVFMSGAKETIPAESQYVLNAFASQNGVMSAEFKSKGASICKISVSCSHSDLQQWTVEDFEDQVSGVFEVHSYLPKNIVSSDAQQSITSHSVKALSGTFLNGLFGSGLPGQYGIQLHIGANLNVYREPAGAHLFEGKKCMLVAQESDSISGKYEKGAKYTFLGFSAHPETKSTDLVFANWSYSPHQIRINCKGTQAQVQELKFEELEHDLNQTIAFYKK